MNFSISRPVLLLAACALLGACDDGKTDAPAGLKPPAVKVALPMQRQVSDAIELDGVVAPSAAVNLVARVAGYLQAAPFSDGQLVKQGELLFVIEPAPYEEQVKLNVARVNQARAESQRQETLLRDDATSQASVENARSQLQQAEANLRLARINLDYTQVRASFDGKIGRRLVDVGNYVGATPGGTVLGTIQKLRPVYVNFSINERALLRLRASLPAPQREGKGAVGTLKVRATLQGESQASEEGLLDFIDSNLSASTGTMALRARFDNRDLHLIPGMYAKIAIDAGQPRDALLLPLAAVQADQQGSYVFVLDAQSRVLRRDVTTGEQFGQLREISAGLKSDEKVVVEGTGNVSSGQLVAATVEVSAPPQPVASKPSR